MMKIELSEAEIEFIQQYCELAVNDYDDLNKKRICINLANKLRKYQTADKEAR